MAGLRCVLFEMGAAIISGVSKGNSVLLHTAFETPSKTLELACMQALYAEYLAIRQKLNLPRGRRYAQVLVMKDRFLLLAVNGNSD